jgi:hypothetical protein
MQLALESPAVIVPLDPVPPTGLVPPLVGVGLGEADGLLEGVGVGVGDDEGLPTGEGLPLDDALPVGDGVLLAEGLALGDGLLSGVPLPVPDAPWPSWSAALPLPGPPACLHGPLGEPGFLVISHESGVPWCIPELALRRDE